ncbi:hypothetical protein KUCAC02_008634 [Chaenocephalus aceratus]|uniref:Uncharacterized protein n=1 Tax=Chaenocephalus aceratus TaxID=36190 RepID=A0ACB9WSM9_CHAAC|nr:hypothetical protein KUCAC02_008634 [Chaenocephalus aceratus]
MNQPRGLYFSSSYSDSASLSVEGQRANVPALKTTTCRRSPWRINTAEIIGDRRELQGTEGQKQRGAANTGGLRGEKRGHGDRRRGRGRGGSRGGKGGRGEKGREREGISVQTRGCLLKEVHLNVTDLRLGYQTKEELIFRYCSGPCVEAETNYDKILNNLTHNKKLDRDTPSRTCCRPIAFDDDLSFLDDNNAYHTLKKHSARKCACV